MLNIISTTTFKEETSTSVIVMIVFVEDSKLIRNCCVLTRDEKRDLHPKERYISFLHATSFDQCDVQKEHSGKIWYCVWNTVDHYSRSY